jgi:small subunit ribosomal protein S8
MMTDPIADMLTRIRNAVRVEHPLVEMSTSKIRRGIAQVLKDEGYIWDFEELETVPARTLRLHMKYGPNGERLITRIDRVSKPAVASTTDTRTSSRSSTAWASIS